MKDSSDLGGCYPKTLLAVLYCYKRLFTTACMGCKRFFLKNKKKAMFFKKSTYLIALLYSDLLFAGASGRFEAFSAS